MTTWTEPMIERLKVLHATGISFADMAGAINVEFNMEISRNAAIGKATRLGLTLREWRSPKAVVTPRLRAVPTGRRKTPFRKPIDLAAALIEHEAKNLPVNQSPCAVTFMQLDRQHCRWPIEPTGKPMMYCGAMHIEGGSYCARHHRIAYDAFVRRVSVWRAA